MRKSIPLFLAIVLLLFTGSTCPQDPHYASSDEDWLMVSSGGVHTCGVKLDGSIECWGCKEGWDYGQCSVPAGTFLSVSAGFFHTCGIKEDNSVVCWGCSGTFYGEDVDAGQCDPTKGLDIEMVDCGNYQTVAIWGEEHLACWGECI